MVINHTLLFLCISPLYTLPIATGMTHSTNAYGYHACSTYVYGYHIPYQCLCVSPSSVYRYHMLYLDITTLTVSMGIACIAYVYGYHTFSPCLWVSRHIPIPVGITRSPYVYGYYTFYLCLAVSHTLRCTWLAHNNTPHFWCNDPHHYNILSMTIKIVKTYLSRLLFKQFSELSYLGIAGPL